MELSKSGRLRRIGRAGLPLLVAVLLGVAASVLVACGQTNGLLSSNDANALGSQLDQVSNAVASTDCRSTASAVLKLRAAAGALKPTVDAQLRRDLRDGANTVADQAAKACRKRTTTTETVPTQTTITPTTSTTPTVTTPTVTTPTVTTPTVTTPTTPTVTTPPPPPTTPADTTPLTVPTVPSGGATPGGTTGTVP